MIPGRGITGPPSAEQTRALLGSRVQKLQGWPPTVTSRNELVRIASDALDELDAKDKEHERLRQFVISLDGCCLCDYHGKEAEARLDGADTP